MIAIDLSQIITAEDKAAQALTALRDRIRICRDRAIAGGLTVEGLTIATDDLSQSRIMGAAISAMLDPGYTVQWKTPAGFVPLNATAVLALAGAVRAHVQACFDHEAAVLAALAGGGAPPDPAAGWP